MNKINLVLNTDKKNCLLNENILQGSTDRIFRFTFHDRGVPILFPDTVKIEVAVLYEPITVNKALTFKGSDVLKPTDANYDVTVKKITDDGNEYSIVEVPLRESFTTYWGNNAMVLKIQDGNVVTYSYRLDYVTDENIAYNPQSLPNNLPSYQGLMKQIQDLITKTDSQQSQITQNKNDITNANTEIGKRVKTDLSNLGDFANVPNGSILSKKDNTIKSSPISVDETNKIINARGYKITTDSVETKPNTLYLGKNISIHENGGFIEYHTESLDKNYILLDYENDPLTGSKKPIYYERGVSENIVLFSAENVVMNNVTSINIGTPSFDREIRVVKMKFSTTVTNFCMRVVVNGKFISHYPSLSAWEGLEQGLSIPTGTQSIPFSPPFTSLTDYGIVCEIKANEPINLLGDGTHPYYEIVANRITRKNIALESDIMPISAIDGNLITIQVMRKTKAEWEASTYIIKSGELAVTTDQQPVIMKIGDGTKTWNQIIQTSDTKLRVAIKNDTDEYVVDKLLFPYATGLTAVDGTGTINTGLVITDENSEISSSCYVIEVPTTSLLSAAASQGNPNAIVLGFKGLPVDGGDGTSVVNSDALSFPDGLVVYVDGKAIVNTAPESTVNGSVIVGRTQVFEFPSTGGVKAEASAGNPNAVVISTKGMIASDGSGVLSDVIKRLNFPDDGLILATVDSNDPNKLNIVSGGIIAKKLPNGIEFKGSTVRFPQGHVSGSNGEIIVGTGMSVSEDDNEITAMANTFTFASASGMHVEIDPNNPNGVIISGTPFQGVSVTKDDTTAENQIRFLYFTNSTVTDGSTTGSIVVDTSTTLSVNGSEFKNYEIIELDPSHFTVTRDANNYKKLILSFNGFSVETGGTEFPAIKVINFSDLDFNVDGANTGVADITLKNKPNNGLLAIYNHRQVIASANAQEIYRTTTLKPNRIIYQDDSINYDTTTGLINLKYTGTNGEKQLFKLVARVTARRQIKDADLVTYLYFVNNATGDYITDVNGETPIVNKTISKDLVSDYIEIATMIAITEDTTIKAIFKDDTPNKFVDILDLAMGTSAIVVEKVNPNNQPSMAMINYEILTQQSMRFIKHEFNQNFENAISLIANTPNTDINVTDGTNLQQDGWIINFQDEGLYKTNTTPDGNANCFQMEDKSSGFGYFNITRILDHEDTWALRGHEITAKVIRAEQQGEFAIVPVVWRRRINEYPMVIITGMNNQGLYSTTDGWEVIDASKTVIVAPTPPETTATFSCTYTVPDDAVNVGFMLMPAKQQDRSIIKFTEFALGCDPTFERWLIKYPQQAIEGQLSRESKYIKFLCHNTTYYNMSDWYQIPNLPASDPQFNNYQPLYVGEAQSGGNADVTRIYNSSSTDFNELHNKGKLRFGKDGRVTIRTKVPIGVDKIALSENHATAQFWYIKDNGTGVIANGNPVVESKHEITLNRAGNVWTDAVRTNLGADWTFTMDVKENEEYWLAIHPLGVDLDGANEGHFYSYPTGSIEITFLENEYKVNQLQAQLDSLSNILKATQDAIDNKVYIELGYDVNNNKGTIETKKEVVVSE